MARPDDLRQRQPAVASSFRAPGEGGFRACDLDVLRVEEDRIAQITTFGPDPLPAFRL